MSFDPTQPYVVPVQSTAADDDARAAASADPADAAAAYATAASKGGGPRVVQNSEGAEVSVEEPTEGDASTHQQRVEQDLDELAAKAERADEYLELAQRTKADFENYRKRAVREAALAQDRGIAKLAKELLPAIDNLDRAVQAVDASSSGEPDGAAAVPMQGDAQLLAGIKLVHAELLAALARGGIEPFSPVGEPFDPQSQEAVAQHPIEGAAPGTVIEVYQLGYRLGETVLRPARVLVAA
jgi:molecular chaperone GrpE